MPYARNWLLSTGSDPGHPASTISLPEPRSIRNECVERWVSVTKFSNVLFGSAKPVYDPGNMPGALQKVLQPHMLVGRMDTVVPVAHAGRHHRDAAQRPREGVDGRAAAAHRGNLRWFAIDFQRGFSRQPTQ